MIALERRYISRMKFCSSLYFVVSFILVVQNVCCDDSFLDRDLPFDVDVIRSLDKLFTYVQVHNLSGINVEQFFMPIPTVFQPKPPHVSGHTHATTTSRPTTTRRTTTPTVPKVTTKKPATTTTKKPATTSSPTTTTLQAPSPIGYATNCGIRRTESDSDRIVGGTQAEPAEFPWQISLQLVSGWSTRHICGGSVISPHWVVTAAHCVFNLRPNSLSVVAGDYDLYRAEGQEQRVNVIRIIGNGYSRVTYANDLALLEVDPPFVLDGVWVAPICLPENGRQFVGGYGVVTGWGRLSEEGSLPQVLQQVNLPLISKHRCDRLYTDAGYHMYLNQCQLCSGLEEGGIDSCQGDSGGPMACKGEDNRYYLCGVVSWGVGCARPRFPGVYTAISCYSDWIADILYNRNYALENAIPLES